ncbi:hypothetical protein HPB48_006386 [Haemaphysalis longicornis]|uniref:Uncharacterized protein n=1 Tax=Haemaphysalis longicornis TaxID=44386 RepID=A0A9J6FLI9_HAELO|nr:hypothetical protein HPB48_006386 [Haemaphysalis longicornis]
MPVLNLGASAKRTTARLHRRTLRPATAQPLASFDMAPTCIRSRQRRLEPPCPSTLCESRFSVASHSCLTSWWLYLNLSKYDPCTLHAMFHNKASLSPTEAAKFMVHVDNVKNLAFLQCLVSDISKQLQQISRIDLQDLTCHIPIYPAIPSNTCKGVVHNIPAGTSRDHLMRHLSTLFHGTKVLAARMMGRTASAIITSEGTHISRETCYAGAIFRCRPHPPKAQYCHRCQ